MKTLHGFFFLSMLVCSNAFATTITIVNLDGAGEGLNDPTAVTAVAGNPALTRGGQFLNVFQAAADYWELRIDSAVDIKVGTQLDPLFCDAVSATLGSAGPNNGAVNFAGAPLANTIYSIAQANSLAGVDLDTAGDDVNATFNSNVNGSPGCLNGLNWWLGINAPAPAGTINLFDTVLHEIGHGIGFLSFVSQAGVKASGFDDAYMVNLLDLTSNMTWPSMSNAQRAASSTNSGNLVWNGTNVTALSTHITAGKASGKLRMYAPFPFQGGSSVSHWDTALLPNELMEPFATLTSNDCSTILALKDMGWNTKSATSQLELSSSNYIGIETQGSVAVSISRTGECGGAPTGAVGVTLTSSDVSATAGTDYTAVNQIVSWADGESGSKTVIIPITADGLVEPNETFNLTLGSVTGGAILVAPTTAQVTINDDVADDELCVPIKASNGNIAVICL